MNYKTLALTLLLGLGSMQAQAEMIMSHEGHDMSQMGEMGNMKEMGEPQAMTKGVISRIDAANGKLGIKHEAIANLKMPPMTMVFRVADPALLNGLQVGDAVHFHAENPAGKLTVTQLQKQ